MKNSYIAYFFIAVLFISCSDDTGNAQIPNNPETAGEWLIPIGEVRDGGPGKDGIPALENPAFITATEVSYLSDDDLIIGLKYDNEVRAYPHKILDWHEIVNDDLKDLSVAITYCPLTGTAIGWNRFIEGINRNTTFGVSGLLYNTNLIPYDRATDSNWTQIGLECVNGELIDQKIKVEFLVETTWKTWKTLYPETKVLGLNTGFSRDYSRYPYGDYITNNNNLIFPVAPLDDRLPSKQRVLSVVMQEKAKIYQFKDFDDGKVIKDTFQDKNLIVAGDKNFMVAFELLEDQENIEFSFQIDGEVIFTDSEGNSWNIFGEALGGPREGEKLNKITAFMAYFFSVGAFYDTPEIF